MAPGTVTFGGANALNTSASFSQPGSYVLRLTADDSQLSTSDDVTITVNPTGGGGGGTPSTIDVRVSSNSDDAEERADGNVALNSSDLELVFDKGGNQTVGMRFNGINIPQGATITNAYLQFQVDETSSIATSITIRGQASDNPGTFTTASGNISTRPTTGASANWSIPVWNTVGQAGANQRTPDLSPLIQEIVAQLGWSSGNSLVLIITGSGERLAEAYNGDVNGAPLLHVEFGP